MVPNANSGLYFTSTVQQNTLLAFRQHFQQARCSKTTYVWHMLRVTFTKSAALQASLGFSEPNATHVLTVGSGCSHDFGILSYQIIVLDMYLVCRFHDSINLVINTESYTVQLYLTQLTVATSERN